MLIGGGRHRLVKGSFRERANIEPYGGGSRSGFVVGKSSRFREEAFDPSANAWGHGGGSGGALPPNTNIRSFAKPASVGLNIGLVSNDPHQVITLAREMYDNDAVLGAVVDTLAGIPFGSFSLSGIPKEIMRDR